MIPRMTAVRIALLCLGLAPLAAAAPGEKDPKQAAEFKKQVQEAIDRGVEWLLKQQGAGGKFPSFADDRGEIYPLGMHALATLAVMKGGQPLDSPEVLQAMKALESLRHTYRNALRTYEVGLYLMVLDAQYSTPPKGKHLPAKRKKTSARDLEVANEFAIWLQKQQQPPGLWRYPEGGVDLSNTQYAALGLWAAHRMGVEIHKGVVRRMLEGTLERQQPTGARVPYILDPEHYKARKGEHRSTTTIQARGWRYLPEEIVTLSDGTTRKIVYPYSGSMTSAGIAILAIGRDILGEKDSWMTEARDRQIRTGMWEGLAWLQANWELEDNPGQPGNWPFYWLYGLERCARLSGVEYVGTHDWYLEGAARLVADQRPDGSWPKNPRMRPKGDQNVRWWSDQVDTCFAILFLTLSTPEIKTPPPAITGS